MHFINEGDSIFLRLREWIMNEFEELSKIDSKNLPSLSGFHLDDLHQKALLSLHLELGMGPVLYLLSPSYTVLNPTPNEDVNDFIQKEENLFDYVKTFLVHSLSVYSVLLDVNSYFVEQNDFLLLARLRERDSGGRRFEVKFYTHSPHEILSHYKDKIYIGRDFFDLYQFEREHFGLQELIGSLKAQYEVLLDKAEQKLKKPLEYKSFFQEIKESVNELYNESLQLLQTIPTVMDFTRINNEDLIGINAQYRTINHFLIELNDEVAEFENLLRFHKEIDFSRYVTKYKKDLSNLISFFNIKIIGYLSGKIRNFKSR